MTSDSHAAPPEVQWLSKQQQQEWVSLVALLMLLPGRLDAQLKQDAGINLFEYHLLVALAEAPERRRIMSDLATQIKGSLSRLSHAVSRLETSGWLRRRSCGGAGRTTEIILTSAGWRELQRIAPGHVREVRRLVVDPLSADEFQALGVAARGIVTAIDPLVALTLVSASSTCRDNSDAQRPSS